MTGARVGGQLPGPVDAAASPHAVLRPLGLDEVTLHGGFWEAPVHANAVSSLPAGLHELDATGALANFQLVAEGGDPAAYRGPVFADSDVYKWLEAASWQMHLGPDARLEASVHRVIELLGAAQAGDGYLNTHYQLVEPGARWRHLSYSHELYCAGHLIQAAVAHHRVRGAGTLLGVARRAADQADATFGPGRLRAVDGHPEIEMALVELYRATGERRYLELARFFVDQRGHGLLGRGRHGGDGYFQDHLPVREARTVEGHAVRQVYLGAGVVDLYLETGERALLDAGLDQWQDMVTRKLYLTGGIGSQHSGEAFGEPYELPNERAYAETCAAIGSLMWSWRLLLATGESRFADLIERILFNGFLSGVALEGGRYFYVNPLLSRGVAPLLGRKLIERTGWFSCACCPPNVMRTLASLTHYFVTRNGGGVQVHQFAPMRIARPGARITVETDYPWNGDVQVSIDESGDGPWELALRIPAWSRSAQLEVNGVPAEMEAPSGYARIRRSWRTGDVVRLRLEMVPRLTVAGSQVDAARGCVAVERGPIVYCLEQPDQEPGLDVLTARIDPGAPLTARRRRDLLGGIVAIEGRGRKEVGGGPAALYGELDSDEGSKSEEAGLTLIPYYAWANRGPARMRVWIPRV